MEIATTFNHLQAELNQAREKLKGVDENIKKFLGRDPNEGPLTPKTGIKRTIGNQLADPRGRGRTVMLPPGRRREFGGHMDEDDGPPPGKRRPTEGNVFSRLSGPVRSSRRDMDSGGEDDDYSSRPSIQSQVISTAREEVSRQEVVAAQNADEKGKARNRRMFGALLGTLQKFRQEETKMKDKEDKRALVELKLEEAARNEREQLRHEKIALFNERKRKQADIKKIEYKMYRMKTQEEWEAKQLMLVNFIKTKANPPIFYLPKSHIPRTLELLEATKEFVNKNIEAKRRELQDELENVERRGGNRRQQDKGGDEGERQRNWRSGGQQQQQQQQPPANAENQQDEDSDLEAEGGPELDDGGGPGKEEGEEEEEGELQELVKGVKEQGDVIIDKVEEGEVLNGVEKRDGGVEGEEKPIKVETIVEGGAGAAGAAVAEASAEPNQVNTVAVSTPPEESQTASTAMPVDEKEFEPVYD